MEGLVQMRNVIGSEIKDKVPGSCRDNRVIQNEMVETLDQCIYGEDDKCSISENILTVQSTGLATDDCIARGKEHLHQGQYQDVCSQQLEA